MIFNAPSREKAEEYLAEIVKKYAQIAPKLADWRGCQKNCVNGLS